MKKSSKLKQLAAHISPNSCHSRNHKSVRAPTTTFKNNNHYQNSVMNNNASLIYHQHPQPQSQDNRILEYENYLTEKNNCRVLDLQNQQKRQQLISDDLRNEYTKNFPAFHHRSHQSFIQPLQLQHPSSNILTPNPKELWLCQTLPAICTIDLSNCHQKPLFYNRVGFYCWHEYDTNPKVIQLEYCSGGMALGSALNANVNSTSKNIPPPRQQWKSLAKIRLQKTDGWQNFKFKMTSSNQLKILRITILESYENENDDDEKGDQKVREQHYHQDQYGDDQYDDEDGNGHNPSPNLIATRAYLNFAALGYVEDMTLSYDQELQERQEQMQEDNNHYQQKSESEPSYCQQQLQQQYYQQTTQPYPEHRQQKHLSDFHRNKLSKHKHHMLNKQPSMPIPIPCQIKKLQQRLQTLTHQKGKLRKTIDSQSTIILKLQSAFRSLCDKMQSVQSTLNWQAERIKVLQNHQKGIVQGEEGEEGEEVESEGECEGQRERVNVKKQGNPHQQLRSLKPLKRRSIHRHPQYQQVEVVEVESLYSQQPQPQPQPQLHSLSLQRVQKQPKQRSAVATSAHHKKTKKDQQRIKQPIGLMTAQGVKQGSNKSSKNRYQQQLQQRDKYQRNTVNIAQHTRKMGSSNSCCDSDDGKSSLLSEYKGVIGNDRNLKFKSNKRSQQFYQRQASSYQKSQPHSKASKKQKAYSSMLEKLQELIMLRDQKKHKLQKSRRDRDRKRERMEKIRNHADDEDSQTSNDEQQYSATLSREQRRHFTAAPKQYVEDKPQQPQQLEQRHYYYEAGGKLKVKEGKRKESGIESSSLERQTGYQHKSKAKGKDNSKSRSIRRNHHYQINSGEAYQYD